MKYEIYIILLFIKQFPKEKERVLKINLNFKNMKLKARVL